MSYIPLFHVATGDLATASLHNTLLDNLTAIVGGLVDTGFPLLDLLGATLPAISITGHARIAYDTATDEVYASTNAGAYSPLGSGFRPSDAIAITMGS